MNPNLLSHVRRRVEVKELYYDGRRGRRSYLVYNPESRTDRINLIKYIAYSLTIVQPLLVSLRGYLHKPDVAWFLHPIMCFLMVVGYGWSEIEWQLRRLAKSIGTR